MSTERTIDATKVNPSATAEGDAFVMTSAGGSLKKCDIDAITARLKELGVVSGRNIVKDSYPDKETTEYTLALLEYTEELAVGDIITITLFGELGSQKEYLQAIHNGGDGTRGATRLSKISDGIYRGTMIIHRTDGDGALHLYAVPNTVTSASKIKCVMVERGKTGSLMWTPAPEDVADLLANRGGVKPIFPTCYTSHPQSAEKGVRHERQDLRSKGCLEVFAGTGNPQRTVRPLRGRIRRTSKIWCKSACKTEHAPKRHERWQRRGYMQSDSKCSKHPNRTIQYLRPNCLSRAKFIRSTDIYSVACGECRKDFHTSMFQQFVGFVGLYGSHKGYVTTPRRKEVVAA